MIRETWGWMHYSFYVAFVGLLIGTTIVAINSDVRDLFDLFGLDLYFYYGDFYLYFKAAMDTFFLLLIARRADGRYAAFRAQADRAQRAARRQDARQPRESARLLVPDADDGAGRHHRPDARRRAHQRVASRRSPNGHTSGASSDESKARSAPARLIIDGSGWCTCCACTRCCFASRSPSCAI